MQVNLTVEQDDFDLYLAREGGKIKIEVDGEMYEAEVTNEDGTLHVRIGDETYAIRLGDQQVEINGDTVPYRLSGFHAAGGPGAHGAGAGGAATVKPPMPGKVVEIRVKEGDEVEKGQVLLILEAMKMQNEIAAPASGTVQAVHVQPGQNVEAKDLLLEIA